jgi:hypothetical protein
MDVGVGQAATPNADCLRSFPVHTIFVQQPGFIPEDFFDPRMNSKQQL